MQRTNLSGSPYFDDFSKEKNFHKVLFRPRPVQARELNQVQSILMNQIERLGNHLFNEGSMVIPGGIRIIRDQPYASFDFSLGSSFGDIQGLDDLKIRSNSTGLNAKISKTMPVVGTDKPTLFVDYDNSGSSQEKEFSAGELCTIVTSTGTELANVVIAATGKGIWAKVKSGVYFVRGMLVATEDQEHVVSKYSTDSTAKIGFSVSESIIDETNDASLLSNAAGTPNFKAPGANRLKVTLTLTSFPKDVDNSNFIELSRLENGEIQSQIDSTSYSVIQKAIAQRTYETSGDYVVNEYGIEIKEHLKTDTNNGVYSVADGGTETKLVAMIKPGVGYVKGYRVENIGSVNVEFEKARDTAVINNSVTAADYGPYILVNTLKSLPNIDITKKVLLLNTVGVTIGYTRVRAIRKDGASIRLYVFDTTMNEFEAFGNVRSVKYTDGSNLVTANLVSTVIYNSSKSNLLFPLPVSAIKTLLTNGVSDTSYVVTRSFNVTTNGVGVATASVGLEESFDVIDSSTYFVAETGAATLGQQYVATDVITLSGNPVGSSVTINLGPGAANKTIRLIAPVIKETTTQKIKTLTTVSNEVIAFSGASSMKLQKADIFRIVSIVDANTNADVTSAFTLDNGQRGNWYQVGSIQTASGQNITQDVKVTYEYFEHSAGDYFSADSYGGLSRTAIPMFEGKSLFDCLDFRPTKDFSGDFTNVTVTGEIVKPNEAIRADITYYLPRWDAVYADSDGTFGIVKGIPGLSPAVPSVPDSSMRLYNLYVPAYTERVSDVLISKIENRRYTMRDIGKLDSRIKNIEYYTTLSALESKTNSTQVFDPVTGNNRFKNGFAVDGFNDFRLADVADKEWGASMDLAAGQLKPQFVENGSDITTHSSMVAASKRGNVYTKEFTEVAVISQPYATTTININPYGVFAWKGNIELTPNKDYWVDTKYLEPIIINNTLNLRGNAVQGSVWGGWKQTTYDMLGGHRDWARQQRVNYQTTTTFNESLDVLSRDNQVATNVIPFMRSIDIQFHCTGFRPFTRLYPFWDGVAVSPESAPSGGAFGDPIVTNAAGEVYGVYRVPNRWDKSFRTGTSVLRFTDSATDSRDPNVLTTDGTATFTSGGTSITRQVTTVNTKILTATSTVTGVQYIDPIAQTFLVPTDGGMFVSKIDAFFATKAANVPVTMQLRTVSAGLPTSDVLAKKTLNPNQVNVSANGDVPTAFVFDDPIFLPDNREYAIVLMADTQEYTVFISQLGQNVIGKNFALAKQPNMGVFLTSSNGATWTPNQLQDLKFTVYRAKFNTNDTSIVTFDSTEPAYLPLSFNAISTVSGSNAITVNMKSHGLKAGDSVVLSGVVDGNGILGSSFNGIAKTVVSSTIDAFVITAPSNANATGTIGGANMVAKANYPFTAFVANIESVDFSGTSTVWEYRYRQQGSRAFSDWINFATKDTVYTDREGVLLAGSDFQIRVKLNTSVDNLTPCVDISAFNVVYVSPRINLDFNNPVYSYVSSTINFDNPSTSAMFYVGANLPNGSNMKVYYKPIYTADDDLSLRVWTEVAPNSPITNDMSRTMEYTYEVSNIGSFVGYKIKIVLVGSDPVSYPTLTDLRTIALA